MAEDPNTALPAAAGVVGRWIDDLFAAQPPIALWAALDEPLRLALAQGWIWSRGYVDDHAAHAMAEPWPDHAEFDEMFGALVEQWRYRYADLRGGFGIVGGTRVAGVDTEMVLITDTASAGESPPDVTVRVQPFLTRFTGGEWLIAATGRRLPIPGWPPTEDEASD